MTQCVWKVLGVAGFAVAAITASVQPAQAADISVGVAAGRLVADGASRTEFGTGYAIFEGSLDTLLSGPRWRTTSPAFDVQAGTFGPADVIHFAPVGTLSGWDGSTWGTVGREVLVVRDRLDETATYSNGGVVTSPAFVGFIHDGNPIAWINQQVVFTLQTNPLGISPAVGAYRVSMQLQSSSYAASDPFWLVFNRGLSTEAFAESVQAMAVPEPEAYALMALGLGVVVYVARRRRR